MPRHKTFDREAVLRKAMTLFWEKGFHATSMQDLVDHLGINRSSIYDTFTDKENLFLEALRLYQREGTRGMQDLEKMLAKKNARDFIRDFFRQLAMESINDEEQKGCFIANSTAEVARELDDACLLLTANKDKFLATFTRLIQIGQQRGEISSSKNAADIASYLFLFMNGLRLVARIDNREETLLHAVEVAMDAL